MAKEYIDRESRVGRIYMSEILLKPCPFCGSRAELRITKHIPKDYDYTPRCTNPSCCGRLSKKFSVKETAIYAWNKRLNDGK